MSSDPFRFTGKSRPRKPRTRHLTPNQQTILEFIHRYFDRTGSVPSVRRIAEEALGKQIGRRTALSYVKRIAAQKHLEMLDDLYPVETEMQKRKDRKETPYRLPIADSPARIPILLGMISGCPSGHQLLLRVADMCSAKSGVPDVQIDAHVTDLFAVRLTEESATPPLAAGALLICSRQGSRANWVATGEIKVENIESVSVRSAPQSFGLRRGMAARDGLGSLRGFLSFFGDPNSVARQT